MNVFEMLQLRYSTLSLFQRLPRCVFCIWVDHHNFFSLIIAEVNNLVGIRYVFVWCSYHLWSCFTTILISSSKLELDHSIHVHEPRQKCMDVIFFFIVHWAPVAQTRSRWMVSEMMIIKKMSQSCILKPGRSIQDSCSALNSLILNLIPMCPYGKFVQVGASRTISKRRSTRICTILHRIK